MRKPDSEISFLGISSGNTYISPFALSECHVTIYFFFNLSVNSFIIHNCFLSGSVNSYTLKTFSIWVEEKVLGSSGNTWELLLTPGSGEITGSAQGTICGAGD